MLINKGAGRLVIGRFSILPGDKLPAVPLTSAEAADVEKMKRKGVLVEYAPVNAKPAEAPKSEIRLSEEKKRDEAKHEDKPFERKKKARQEQSLENNNENSNPVQSESAGE